MEKQFVEEQISQVKQTIENLKKPGANSEDYRQKLLKEAEDFLAKLETLKAKAE
jgi:hypothetical protein